MTRVLYSVKSRLPLCRDVMLCRENSVYLSSVELESEIFPPSWMELLFRFYLHENTETLPNNKDMDASALNDCLLRKIKNQPKPHRALKVSLITQDVTSMASSYSHLFRLGNFPEWSPLLYPLPISKLFLEKNLSATGTNNCIIFALSIIFAFEVMMEIMLAWILTLFIPTSRTLIRSQVLTWLTPFGEIGQWVCLQKSNKITLQIRQWFFPFSLKAARPVHSSSAQSEPLTAKILLSQDLCYPGIVIILFELGEITPWTEKAFIGNLHRSRHWDLQSLPNIQSVRFSLPSLGKGRQ